jgi:hypothetical protein
MTIEVKVSKPFKDECEKRALEIFTAGETSGVLNKESFGNEMMVFIEEEPENFLFAFLGAGELEGKKIYVGGRKTQ